MIGASYKDPLLTPQGTGIADAAYYLKVLFQKEQPWLWGFLAIPITVVIAMCGSP
jgi:hypothetical protein